MKYQSVLSACLLLLWTLTAFVSTDEGSEKLKLEVKKLGANKFELVCTHNGKKKVSWKDDAFEETATMELEYKDENSGEYACHTEPTDSEKEEVIKILVKFRSCDNCIELDVASISGMAVGDLVATAVIGVAVYLIASQARGSLMTSPQKKSSDRQHLVSNEVTGRSANDHYERLRHKGGQKDTYDVINKK